MMKKIREALKKNIRNNEKGFTLIELLVVVVILGALAAVVIPRISANSDDAKQAADQANLKIIQSAVERYYLEEDVYPDATDYAGLKDDLVPDYINELPVAQGGTFTYTSSKGVVAYTADS